MKYLHLIIFLIIADFTNAQDSIKVSKPKTKIDSLSQISGSLSKREFRFLDRINGCEIDVIKLTRINEKDSVFGLFFQNSYSAVLDEQEIDGFLRSLKYIQEKISEPFPKDYTEYKYLSNGDFKITIYSLRATWLMDLQLDKYYAGSTTNARIADLPRLISIVEDAKMIISKSKK